MPDVDSSAIERVDYNAERCLLFVTFTGGRRYIYFDVPESAYRAFLAAPSPGQFFNTEIRDRYAFHAL
jgi:KTSC domain